MIELRQIHVLEIIHLRELGIDYREHFPVDLPDRSAQSLANCLQLSNLSDWITPPYRLQSDER